MDRTAELRWFFRRSPPAPVVGWFEKTADPAEERTDVYLVLPGTDALGVKIRGGSTKFEFKLRPRPGERLGLPGGVTGQIEEWHRWSFARGGLTRLLPRLGLPRADWVPVVKRRRQTTIPFRGGAGCKAELTTLAALDQHWMTVGFESYGPDVDLVPALEAAADALFASIDLPGTLDAEFSGGYPGWLANL